MRITQIKRTRDQRKKRVAAYCRVSTRLGEQEESYETQIRTYTDYITANPEWEFAAVYSDEKSATKAENRPGFQQMIQDAVDGKIDLILVKSISRFSRNTVDCQNYANYLRGNGVEVFFEKEQISTDDPSSSMIFSLMGAIAQDESRSIGENVRWSYRERYRRGEYNLGNNRILGYDTINGALVPNRDAWEIQYIFQLFLEGKTYKQISEAVKTAGGRRLRSKKPMTSSVIRTILKNETYAGDKLLQKRPHTNFLTKRPDPSIPWESTYLYQEHTPIIDRRTWDAAQEIFRLRQKEKEKGVNKTRRTHFLYGKLFCGECQAPYTRRTRRAYAKIRKEGETYKAWICRERRKSKNGNGCQNSIFREEELLRQISEQLGWEWSGADRFESEKFCALVERVEVEGDKVRVKRANSE